MTRREPIFDNRHIYLIRGDDCERIYYPPELDAFICLKGYACFFIGKN